MRGETTYQGGFLRLGESGSVIDLHCRHCAQEPFLHGEGERCYTNGEMDAALRFHATHGRWPAGLFRPHSTQRRWAPADAHPRSPQR